jgi:hypothetical protein
MSNMKYILPLIFLLAAVSCFAGDGSGGEMANLSNIKIEEPTLHPTSSWDQMAMIEFGKFTPSSVQVTNGSYRFNYGNNASTYMGEAGWALKLFSFGGSFYVQEGLAFSALSGSAMNNSNAQPVSSSYTLDLFGLDSRLVYAADWFPWKPLIPFAEGGYQLTVFYQGGSSGLDSVSGSVGNPVAGAGLRLWLNRRASMSGNSLPVFLVGKANRIFTSSNDVNLAATSFLGGVSFGL